MALLLRRLPRYPRHPRLPRQHTLPPACLTATPPAVPPCPPCRTRPDRRLNGLQLTCRPPPQGTAPPCAARLLNCSITCDSPKKLQLSAIRASGASSCGSRQDAVAVRHEEARRARQEDYDREVAARRSAERAACRPARRPARTYRLSGEGREQGRDTDGRAVWLRSPASEPLHCGRDRVPPKPIALLPDTACRPRPARAALDPCAHRPRVVVHVDRTPPVKPVTALRLTAPAPPEAAAAPKPGWCSHLPVPAPEPKPCRPTTLLDWLEGRGNAGEGRRRLHTAAALARTVRLRGERWGGKGARCGKPSAPAGPAPTPAPL